MKLARWIWPLNVAGATAVANLACITVLGVLCLCLFPRFFPFGYVQVDKDPRWKLAVIDVLTLGMGFLAFPVGWVGHFTGYSWGAVVFVPINAYFWGAIAQSGWRWRMQKARSKREILHACSNESCSVHFTVGLKQCPGCGAPAPEQIPSSPEQLPSPTVNDALPSAFFILTAGVAAPAICGGVALAVLAMWEPAIIFGAALAGASFIAFVVRWLNRRDSSGRRTFSE